MTGLRSARRQARAGLCTALRCLVAFGAAGGLPGPAAAEDPFVIQTLALEGRVVQADLVDLDGDGRGDLLCIAALGLPPHERRKIQVFYQRPDGTLPEVSDWSATLPDGVAAYDLATLDARSGAELILLRRDRLTLLSLAERAAQLRDLEVGDAPTLAVASDELGIDRLLIAREGLADELRLLVPGLGWTAVLAPSGEVLGRLDVGARANYFLPPRSSPVFSESEAEIYFDHPRVSIGDVDGDGRGDLVTSNRHEVRVFLQDAKGRFPRRPSRALALGLVTPEDHVRNTGTVRVEGADFDADGRLDLLISSSSGSPFTSSTQTAIHLNRGGGWKLDRPDQVFRSEKGLVANRVIDLDGDGQLELVELRVPTEVLEVVEVLVTRAIDAEVSIYHRGDGALFEAKPWHRWTLGAGISFDTFRTLGFVPTLLEDLNGDGMKDLLDSGDGERLEVHLGRRDGGYVERQATQPLDTAGRIRFGDLDADGLADFVIYNPQRTGSPVRVGTNRGVLPGTQRKTEQGRAPGGPDGSGR